MFVMLWGAAFRGCPTAGVVLCEWNVTKVTASPLGAFFKHTSRYLIRHGVLKKFLEFIFLEFSGRAAEGKTQEPPSLPFFSRV